MNKFKSPTTMIYGLFIIGCLFMITACAPNNNSPRASKVNAKQNKQMQGTLFKGAMVTEEVTYANINGGIARLRAMMCGKFIHYVIPKGSTDLDTYKVWLVNDGQDSVVHYILPLGTPNKDGYWIYIHQCLTSLPDEPTFATLAKLTQVDRDTILCGYHTLPSDFNTDISAIVDDPEAYFEELDLKSIGSKAAHTVFHYLRQSPLEYLGEGPMFAKEVKNTKIRFIRRYKKVNPQKTHNYKHGYDENKEIFTQTKGEFLLKKAMINPRLMKD